MIGSYLGLLRPHQYLKNLFIFLPLFFGLKMYDTHLMIYTAAAFLAFCGTASAVYIFNDIRDIEDDRRHPVKKSRPLASGAVPVGKAVAIMILLLAASISLSLFIGAPIALLLLGYVAINAVYTLWLKHHAILDITVIAVGFILRLFVGSESSGVALSMWIILMTFLLAFFLGLAKRRDELLVFYEQGEKTRKAIDGYNKEFIDSAMIIMASVTIVAYIMYTISSDVMRRVHSDKLYITVLWVVLGIMRYLQITLVDKKSGSPTLVLIKDRLIQLILACWIISFWIIIYL